MDAELREDTFKIGKTRTIAKSILTSILNMNVPLIYQFISTEVSILLLITSASAKTEP